MLTESQRTLLDRAARLLETSNGGKRCKDNSCPNCQWLTDYAAERANGERADGDAAVSGAQDLATRSNNDVAQRIADAIAARAERGTENG